MPWILACSCCSKKWKVPGILEPAKAKEPGGSDGQLTVCPSCRGKEGVRPPAHLSLDVLDTPLGNVLDEAYREGLERGLSVAQQIFEWSQEVEDRRDLLSWGPDAIEKERNRGSRWTSTGSRS
jgi:hypothetical protein